MPYPAGILTRQISFGSPRGLEAGVDMTMNVYIIASRSMLWTATGDPFVNIGLTIEGFSETLALPVTDQSGWGDGLGNDYSVYEGAQTHTYSIAIVYKINGSEKFRRTIPAFALPSTSDAVVDIDNLIQLGPPTEGVQVPGLIGELPEYLTPTALADSIAAQNEIQVPPLVAAAIADDDTPALAAAAAVDVALANADVYIESLHSLLLTEGLIVVDPADGGVQTVTLTGNATITPIAGVTPGTTLALVIVTNGFTVTWGPRIRWETTPALSTGTNLTDVVTLVCRQWSWLGFVSNIGIPSGSAPAIIDTFNRPDGALGYTETGEPWVVGTNLAVVDGKVATSVGGITDRAVVDVGMSSGVKVSVVTTRSDKGTRLEARANQDDTTYYRLVWGILTGTSAYFQRNAGGSPTKVGQDFSFGLVAGTQVARIGFSVEESGGVVTLKAYANGDLISTETDSSPVPVGTYAGLIEASGPNALDDFRVDYL